MAPLSPEETWRPLGLPADIEPAGARSTEASPVGKPRGSGSSKTPKRQRKELPAQRQLTLLELSERASSPGKGTRSVQIALKHAERAQGGTPAIPKLAGEATKLMGALHSSVPHPFAPSSAKYRSALALSRASFHPPHWLFVSPSSVNFSLMPLSPPLSPRIRVSVSGRIKADIYIKEAGADKGRGLFSANGFEEGAIITRYDGVRRVISGMQRTALQPDCGKHTLRDISTPAVSPRHFYADPLPSHRCRAPRALPPFVHCLPPLPDPGLENYSKTHMLRIPQSQNLIDGRPLVLALCSMQHQSTRNTSLLRAPQLPPFHRRIIHRASAHACNPGLYLHRRSGSRSRGTIPEDGGAQRGTHLPV